jgi:hypothetical protein
VQQGGEQQNAEYGDGHGLSVVNCHSTVTFAFSCCQPVTANKKGGVTRGSSTPRNPAFHKTPGRFRRMGVEKIKPDAGMGHHHDQQLFADALPRHVR